MPKARGRYRTEENTDLLARIQQLEEKIDRLERVPRIGNTAIDKGALIIKDELSNAIIEIGLLSDGRYGLRINDTAGVAQIRAGELAGGGYGLEVIDPGTGALVSLATVAFGMRTGFVATAQSRNNTAFGDLATVGPTVTPTVGTSGNLVLFIGGEVLTVGPTGVMSAEFSGPSSVSPSDDKSYVLAQSPNASTLLMGSCRALLYSGLSAGTYTITAKYRTVGGSVSWQNRSLVAIPY